MVRESLTSSPLASTMDTNEFKQAMFDSQLTALNIFFTRVMGHDRRLAVQKYWNKQRMHCRNPIVKCGHKYFSQNDEDGITLEILRRIGKFQNEKLTPGVFVELGVEKGVENNSIILLMNGWRGAWIGGEDLAFPIPPNAPLHFTKTWIDKDNCVALVDAALANLKETTIDFLSVDLDGVDYYITESLLLSGKRPAVITVEYNAKFPPPINWKIAYNPQHTWDGTDYFGASLQAYADLFAGHKYFLVVCNITGVNAFFVDEKYRSAFSDIPTTIGELYQPADYVPLLTNGHPPSPKTVASFLKIAHK